MDVLLVSLGSTAGLRQADDALAEAMERGGATVRVARAARQRDVRTLMLTDYVWARAARRAAVDALDGEESRAILYSTITAALFWPRSGAIRFDQLSVDNRPGRHGVWQRRLEERRLAAAALVVPSSADVRFPEGVVVPPVVDRSGPADGERDIAAITYGTNPVKKGLDRVLRAWGRARSGAEELVVAGIEGENVEGVRYVGRLPPADYRALVRRSRLYLSAPRWEDFGMAQMEALADGCVLVAMYGRGPYVALPLARALDPRLVVRDEEAFAHAIRLALDDPAPDYAARAEPLVAPYSSAAVDALVAGRLLPALLGRPSSREG